MYMNARREFVYLTVLLSVAFLIIGVKTLMNADVVANGDSTLYIIFLLIGVLYLKSGLFEFVEGIRAVLEGIKKDDHNER